MNESSPPSAPAEGAAAIALVNYGMGNLRSVEKALAAAGANPRIVTEPSQLRGAAGLVLPGVGALGDCVVALRHSGMADAIRGWIAEDRPFLGVCLGLQALFQSSEEGGVEGLGVFPGRVTRFRLPAAFKVPHMGWNSARPVQPGSPLWMDLDPAGESFYFVHSYRVVPDDPQLALTVTDYSGEFVSAIARGHCFATQFHPEKSQAKGLQIYRNFATVCRRVVG
jgi:imidazole glycerol-phosphate synthase subunit HisH